MHTRFMNDAAVTEQGRNATMHIDVPPPPPNKQEAPPRSPPRLLLPIPPVRGGAFSIAYVNFIKFYDDDDGILVEVAWTPPDG